MDNTNFNIHVRTTVQRMFHTGVDQHTVTLLKLNWISQINAVSNDTVYNQLWYLPIRNELEYCVYV